MEWSQDGTKLLVSGPVAQEKQAIWVISVIGATLKKLREDANDASLSPDGSQIVFSDTVTHAILLMSADGCWWRRKSVPFCRAERRRWCGFAMADCRRAARTLCL
jgi:hypothetical protein